MRVNKNEYCYKESFGGENGNGREGKNREEERPLCFVGGETLGLREGVGFDKLTWVCV